MTIVGVRLVEILRSKPAAQMSYQIGFCLWLLSFEESIANEINKCVRCLMCICLSHIILTPRKYDVIPLLVEVAQEAVKEKVIRVIVATFRVCFYFSRRSRNIPFTFFTF